MLPRLVQARSVIGAHLGCHEGFEQLASKIFDLPEGFPVCWRRGHPISPRLAGLARLFARPPRLFHRLETTRQLRFVEGQLHRLVDLARRRTQHLDAIRAFAPGAELHFEVEVVSGRPLLDIERTEQLR